MHENPKQCKQVWQIQLQARQKQVKILSKLLTNVFIHNAQKIGKYYGCKHNKHISIVLRYINSYLGDSSFPLCVYLKPMILILLSLFKPLCEGHGKYFYCPEYWLHVVKMFSHLLFLSYTLKTESDSSFVDLWMLGNICLKL